MSTTTDDKPAPKTRTRFGREYVTVWKRGSDGAWRDQHGLLAPGNRAGGKRHHPRTGGINYLKKLIGEEGEALFDAAFKILEGTSPYPVTTKDQISVIKWLADRYFGKAVERVEITDERTPTRFDDLTPEQLREARAAIERLRELSAPTKH